MNNKFPGSENARLSKQRLSSAKRFVLLVVGVVATVPTLEAATGAQAIGYVDEVVIIAMFAMVSAHRLLSGRSLRMVPGSGLYMAFVAAGVVSALAAEVNFGLLAAGTLLVSKLFILSLAIVQIDWAPADLPNIAQIGIGCGIVVGLSALLNVVLGEAWIRALNSSHTPYINYRYGFLSMQGMFTHPLALSAVGAILVSCALSSRSFFPHLRHAQFAAILSGFAVVSTFRRSGVAAAVAGWIVGAPRNRRTTTILVFLFAVPTVLYILWDQLAEMAASTVQSYFSRGSQEARTILTLDSVDIANSHFPLGAGLSRFGTFLAREVYSPEYTTRGYPGVWGLQPEGGYGAFLTDTQWPAVLGESGWIGAVCLAGFFAVTFRTVSKFRNSSIRSLAWLGHFGTSVVLIALISSAAAPVFYSGPVLPLFALICGIAGVLRERVVGPLPSERQMHKPRSGTGWGEH